MLRRALGLRHCSLSELLIIFEQGVSHFALDPANYMAIPALRYGMSLSGLSAFLLSAFSLPVLCGVEAFEECTPSQPRAATWHAGPELFTSCLPPPGLPLHILLARTPAVARCCFRFPSAFTPVNSVMGALCVRSTGSGQEECIQLTCLLGAYACLADTRHTPKNGTDYKR